MSKQVKDLLTLGAAAFLVLTLSLWGIFKSDDAVSESERRPLKQFPLFSAQEVLSGRFQSNFESYTLDQFPLRDTFRTLKALSRPLSLRGKGQQRHLHGRQIRRQARRHDP